MENTIIRRISALTDTKTSQVEAVLKLLDEGATVPFIARYRKEATGELDEVQILAVRDTHAGLTELEKRREAILKSLTERELLTPELNQGILSAETLPVLEDLYLPFRPKKRTRGMIAREAGLEPLAEWLLSRGTGADLSRPLDSGAGRGAREEEILEKARGFLNPEAKITGPEEALAGSRDILAEVFNETGALRQELRHFFEKKALLSSRVVKGKEEDREASRYRDYFDWTEPASRAPSHRILAVLRGTAEGFLHSSFAPPEEEALVLVSRHILGKNRLQENPAAREVWAAAEEGYGRLTAPSLENEYRKACKERADQEAIRVFAGNIRELLLASPLGQKRVLALDPGLRTGCKLVCLDDRGDLRHESVIYPLVPKNQVEESARMVQKLCREYDIQAVAVGNGTGGREAEAFARKAVEGLTSADGKPVAVVMVNESGASVYSASAAAREEFPDRDVTVRGAVSIGRRLMDPLAELVKIDPKSIGVGQYQHDVDQKSLKQSLDDTVLSCVNAVGVEVNTASRQLLSYVSGISPRIAGAICKTRETAGPFKNRAALKKVAGMGPRGFEQAAGFLRVRDSANPLDASAVHPESYPVVEKMAADLGCSVADLIKDPLLRRQIKPEKYVTPAVGLPTLRDILAELEKPGRDPRGELEIFQFSDQVHEPKDLSTGMVLPGIVTNVTAFGAFVDVGVHQDGLVHISQLSDSFVKDPADVVRVNQRVTVKVLEVDLSRNRIGLSMKNL